MKQAKMTAKVFSFAAQNYVSRYFASSQMLRRALERRAYRFIRKHGGEMEDAKVFIEEAIQFCIKEGAIDDVHFAQTMVAELQKNGVSQLKIKQKLFEKGISASLIADALKENNDMHNPKRDALLYAKKRGFGPYRAPHITEDRYQKELASMVRAGHPYNISKEILFLNKDMAQSILEADE